LPGGAENRLQSQPARRTRAGDRVEAAGALDALRCRYKSPGSTAACLPNISRSSSSSAHIWLFEQRNGRGVDAQPQSKKRGVDDSAVGSGQPSRGSALGSRIRSPCPFTAPTRSSGEKRVRQAIWTIAHDVARWRWALTPKRHNTDKCAALVSARWWVLPAI
jgi:hypothetical protein